MSLTEEQRAELLAAVAGCPLEYKVMRLAALHLAEENPRLHPERNRKAIRASLERYGQVEALVVQKSNGMIIGGNGRFEEMVALGWKHALVCELDIDDARAGALNVALNRTAETAGWDHEALSFLFPQLTDDSFDIEAYGWNEEERFRFLENVWGQRERPLAPEQIGTYNPDAETVIVKVHQVPNTMVAKVREILNATMAEKGWPYACATD